jgi:uncharacterized protein YbjT (DUF2867 family)
MHVLAVGATGGIGQLVVAQAARRGHRVRALVRSDAKARQLPSSVDAFVGDVTQSDSLAAALDGIDAIVFTLGSDGLGRSGAERIDYGGVRNVLITMGTRRARIALMTSIGITNRDGAYNQSTEAHDWKRRAERLVRASGHPYTIVRPGWFDGNTPDQHRLVMLQGDTRQTGDASDGVVAREQIARVLVASLDSPSALRKTFELVAEPGPAQTDLEPLFASLTTDMDAGDGDGVYDIRNMPAHNEPPHVRGDLDAVIHHRRNPHG